MDIYTVRILDTYSTRAIKPQTLHLALLYLIKPLHSWGLWLKGGMTREGSFSFPAPKSNSKFF